ncbi:f-actin-capping protein subunit alpha [Stemphylium lycopersici]|uniref:F-actin-capping protein subunit alpha n=1 Tax=Stemphylium lycopersici TaxID=183478 RepID=A0A364N8N3_STELY|nr:f-actin-capping protein subunit alpha [Stemphylium lycopersici]
MEKNGDAAFTPINHQPTQLLTPEPSAAASAQEEQNTQSAFGNQRRRHNPAVARYLGLGSTIEPTHLERYAPLPAPSAGPPAKPMRKRRRLGSGGSIPCSTDAYAGRDASNRPFVSESLGIKKAPGRSAAAQSKSKACHVQQLQATDYAYRHTPVADDNLLTSSSPVHFDDDSVEARKECPGASSAQKVSRAIVELSRNGDFNHTVIDSGDDTECVAFDAVNNPHDQSNKDKHANDDDFDFDITDNELLTLTSEVHGPTFDASRDMPSSRKTPHCKAGDEANQIRDNLQTELEGTTEMKGSQRSSKKFISPVTLTTRLLAATGDEGSIKARKPIVRPPFPGSAHMGSRRETVDGREGAATRSQGQPVTTPPKTQSPKARSLSDSAPRLEPSPKFREPARMSKDDHTIDASPSTPRRPDFLSRGLSLQMPPRESHMPSPAQFAARVPLSPQLDARNTYASPGSVLPRRSRGAEFSRACTNLHHSTLPDQSSPDSSPTITQKGIKIPPRKPRSNSMLMESPNVNMHGGGWSHGDRTAPSSSVGSINMMGSEDSNSSSDEVDPEDPEDHDDPMITTPQAKTNLLFPGLNSGNNGLWSNLFSPGAQPNFASMHRARLRKGRSRKSSSSASGHSSMASPGPASPPNGKDTGYFAREAAMRKAGSRRESLSIFANDLHISSGNDSGDEAANLPQTPGVVRRAVTRRGNLLPKSRQFGRIRAELFEEAAPVDSEFRREAEIIRQVRESDVDPDKVSVTAQSSPNLLPAVPGLDGPLEGVPEEGDESNMSLDSSNTKGLFGAFGSLHSTGRNSLSNGFWNQRAAHTPPPPSFPRAESSARSEDMSMDSPTIGTNGGASRASTPGPMQPPTAAEAIKKSNKRRRDDDFDEASIKRRAVSPGVSVHNSPVISQSPAQRDGSLWGTTTKTGRETSISGQSHGERSNSGGSMSMTPTLGPKRIGLQAMSRTAALSSFIDSAPPGELADVTKAIKSILGDESVQNELSPAFQKYNEEQFTTTKLPGGSTEVLVSQYNSLGDGRYYDIDTQSSFDFDHATGKASAVQSYVVESQHDELLKSLNKSLSSHAAEHYPKSSYGVYPVPSSPSSLAIVTVANKYSPTNYWNGRWRSSYIYDTSSGSITGSIKVDVHYYEDGNVRLFTTKEVSVSASGANAPDVMRKIAAEEKRYQEDLNKAFGSLSEGAFKALRRQLPITRQKIEWEKISGYRLGQDIGGGGGRR